MGKNTIRLTMAQALVKYLCKILDEKLDREKEIIVEAEDVRYIQEEE